MAKHLGLWVVVLAAASAQGLTPTLDRNLSEWVGPEVGSLGVHTDPDGGSYEILYTLDGINLYIGIDRSLSSRFLGDTPWDDDSFFLAIDTDGVADSGALSDGYSRMQFAGPLRPDEIYYFAGGNDAFGGFHETSSFDSGGAITWNGWRADPYAYYGRSDAGGDDELVIPLSELGGATSFTVWAWMTREGNGYLEATWPAGSTGFDPQTMTEGFFIPEPGALVLLVFGAVLIRRR